MIAALRCLDRAECALSTLGEKAIVLRLFAIRWQVIVNLDLLPLGEVSVVGPQVVKQGSKLINATCHVDKSFRD